jgi:hypothetical protein
VIPVRISRAGASLYVGGVAIVIWLVGLVRFRGWIATDDHAILQLRLERMQDGTIPLVGAFSRFGFHHPGPAREWIFGALYALSGNRAAALPATALLLNVGFAAAAAAMAFRLGGRAALIAAVSGVALINIGLGFDLHSPWNPFLAVMAGNAAVWGCAAMAADGGRSWPVPLIAATFAAQNHATALLFGLVIIGATVWISVANRSTAGGSMRLTWIGVTLLGLWSGPIIDLANGRDSNVARIVRHSDGDQLGPIDGLRHVSRKLMPWSTWRGETTVLTADPPPTQHALVVAVVVAVVLVAIFVLVVRAGGVDRRLRSLAAVALGTIVVTWLSYAAIVLPAYPYVFAPLSGALTIVWGFGIWRLLSGVAWLESEKARWAVGLAVAVAVASSAGGWIRTEPAVDSPISGGLKGAMNGRIERGVRYEIVSAGMTQASTEAEVALYVEQFGGKPVSSQFNLDLPAPSDQAVNQNRVLITAMTAPLDCIRTSTEPTQLVALDISSLSGLPVGVFLLAEASAMATLRACGLAP